jgi:putative phosphoserine phosphatase/1-acylglycerol-3-phosphate O-acyltransferase
VVPVGLWGTEKVWPRSSRVPNVTNLAAPPRVTVRVGAPITMVGDDTQSDTVRIMEAIMGLLPPELREWREPSPEEIRLATPAGLSSEER